MPAHKRIVPAKPTDPDPNPAPATLSNENPGPPPPAPPSEETQDAAQGLADYLAWQKAICSRLGINHPFENVPDDNKYLVSALQFLRDNGAPYPRKERSEFSWPGAPGTFGTGVPPMDEYVYAANGREYRTSEFFIVLSPSIVLSELKTNGIIPR